MAYFVLLLVEILLLYFLSKSVSRNLSKFVSINLMSFIFSPGVIIHELSHLLMAMILFVPVGNMEFTPRRHGNGVKLGSVEIAKTDPIRRSLIGFAPVLVGLTIIVGVVYVSSSNYLLLQGQNIYVIVGLILVLTYLLFAISNTMFSSKTDMEGALEIFIVILLILGISYVLGFNPFPAILNRIFSNQVVGVIQKSAFFLLAPIIVDLFILVSMKLFTGNRNRT